MRKTIMFFCLAYACIFMCSINIFAESGPISIELNEQYTLDEIRSFIEWSHEKRAQYSAVWRPKYEEYLANHPDDSQDTFLYYSTRYVYGLPDEADISEKEALDLAKQALLSIGVSELTIHNRRVNSFFDITDPLLTLWKFNFGATVQVSGEWLQYDSSPFKVSVDSKSGAIIDLFEIDDSNRAREYF